MKWNIKEYNLENDIALTGIAIRFPEADRLTDFWNNLIEGRDSICHFTDAELLAAGVCPNVIADPNYVKARAKIKCSDIFDYEFFGFSGKQSQLIDLQQRIFLQCAWEALEDSCCPPGKATGKIGIFASSRISSYLLYNMARQLYSGSPYNEFDMIIGSGQDFLATRVSYKLNLTGPSLAIQTACSSSLVATHIACLNLLNYECDVALAGGVSIIYPDQSGYLYQTGGILSPDGYCRAFSEDAAGCTSGDGAAVVVLKRLEDAINDGNHIYAVIKGSAINNDGAAKIGYTAPSMDAQVEVINSALFQAGISANEVDYIESHGTGTTLGDQIETAALIKVFAEVEQGKKCAIGALKNNIGHLDAAAGLAGLIKAAMVVKNRELPPVVHCDKPRKDLVSDKTPFCINTSPIRFASRSKPLYAGISSFGIGGTNAHIILQEPPTFEWEKETLLHPVVIPLSAKTLTAIDNKIKELKYYIAKHPLLELGPIAHSLQIGREDFQHRVCFIVNDINGLLKCCDDYFDTSHDRIIFADNQIRTLCLETYHQVYSYTKKWLQGDSVNWQTIQAELPCKKIPLPFYPFKTSRVSTFSENSPINTAIFSSAGAPSKEVTYYYRSWQQCYVPETDFCDSEEVWLIFSTQSLFVDRLVDTLKNSNQNVILIFTGNEYRYDRLGNYFINPALQSDYEQLFYSLTENRINVKYILHTWLINETNDLGLLFNERDYTLGFSSLMMAAKSMLSTNYENIRWVCLTVNAVKIFSDEVMNATQALTFGFTHTLTQESKSMSAISIDLTSNEINTASTIQQIINAIKLPDKIVLALRGTQYWSEQFLSTGLIPISQDQSKYFKSNGVYIIVGGFGGIGYELAKRLAEIKNINLVLISRDINNSKHKDKLLLLQSTSANIMVYSADITNSNELSKVFNLIKVKFKHISGVIHAAGIRSGGLMQHADLKRLRNDIAVKLEGTIVLVEQCQKDNVEFLILCSSLLANCGSIGQAAYTAVSRYQEAIAELTESKNLLKIKTLSWDIWQKIGMADGGPLSIKDSEIRKKIILSGLDKEDGLSAFFIATEGISLPVVLISKGDLNSKFSLLKSQFLNEVVIEENKKIDKASLTSRSSLLDKDEINKFLTKQLGAMLDFDVLPESENLYSLGFDSLLAVRLLSQIQSHLGVKITFRALMEQPTVNNIISLIHQSKTMSDKKINEKDRFSSTKLTTAISDISPNDVMETLNKLGEQ